MERAHRYDPHDGVAPAAEQVAAQTQAVRGALQRLAERVGPEEAALVLLHELFGVETSEIAAAWRRSEAACRAALGRALRRMRDDTGARANDAATEAALIALCLDALAARSPAPLYSLLREGASDAAPLARRGGAPAGARTRTRLMQAGGTLVQAVVVDGVAICVLPIGVLGGDGAWSAD